MVVRGTDIIRGGNCVEGRRGRDDIEYCNVGTGFGETFGEGEAAATCAASNEGGATFKGELGMLVGMKDRGSV